jgi:hypothetical protein
VKILFSLSRKEISKLKASPFRIFLLTKPTRDSVSSHRNFSSPPHTEATPAQQLEARLIKEPWRTTPWEIADYKHVSDEFQTALTTATAAGTNDIRILRDRKIHVNFLRNRQSANS